MIGGNLQGVHQGDQALGLGRHGVIHIRITGGFAVARQVRHHKMEIAFQLVDEAHPVTGIGPETVDQQHHRLVLLAFTAQQMPLNAVAGFHGLICQAGTTLFQAQATLVGPFCQSVAAGKDDRADQQQAEFQ